MQWLKQPKTAHCTERAIHSSSDFAPVMRWRRVTSMTATHTGVPPIRWRWIVAIWFAGALFDASQTVLIMHAEGRHHAWPPLFATELVSWLPWVLATPLIIRLAHRYPIARGMSLQAVCVHLVAFALISTLAESWSTLLQML